MSQFYVFYRMFFVVCRTCFTVELATCFIVVDYVFYLSFRAFTYLESF